MAKPTTLEEINTREFCEDMGNNCSSKKKKIESMHERDVRKEHNEYFLPKTAINDEMVIAKQNGNNPNAAFDLVGPTNAFIELTDGYENDEGEYIDMSQPREASYSTKTKMNAVVKRTSRLGEDVSLSVQKRNKAINIYHTITTSGWNLHCFRSIPMEVRGITLRQLRAIVPLIKRRCEEEQWTRPVYKNGYRTNDVKRITLENATMYDVNKYMIKPFIKYSKKSFVETLPSTKGTQPPRWFVR